MYDINWFITKTEQMLKNAKFQVYMHVHYFTKAKPQGDMNKDACGLSKDNMRLINVRLEHE